MKMEYKKQEITKSIGVIKKIPLPFKMKKYKETDFHKHIIILRKDKKSRTITPLSNQDKENKKNQGNQKYRQKTNNIIKYKKVKNILPNREKLITKKYEIIPIIAHNSEKPSISTEEIDAGKLYPSIYTFGKDKKEVNNIGKNQKEKCLKEKTINKKYYEEIPIIAHDSEPPTFSFEEIDGGKFISNNHFSVSFCQEKLLNKIKSDKTKNKIKKYNEIPIIAHNSEKPSILFEEISGGKKYNIFQTSITYNKEKYHSKNIKFENNFKSQNNYLKNKKYVQIPIIAHISEKPSIIFEEINSINKKNRIPSEIINDKGISQKKNKKKNYKEIPIIIHNSDMPSITFEEVNTGIPNSLFNKLIK